MKAVYCTSFNGPDSLAYGDQALRAMGPGDVHVRLHVSGVNFADLIMISGFYQVQPDLPFVPGLEGAGVVIAVGADVTAFKAGDHVLALSSSGTYAQELIDHQDRFILLPRSMDFTIAGSFSVVYGTAHIGLVHRARLRAGETLVVHGAGGGAGLAAVELGKALGARVIATASSREKLDLARNKGADAVINTSSQSIRDEILSLTDGRGADVIYDPVGGSVFRESLRAIAFEGRIVLIGFASGEVPQIPANHLLVKNVDIIGLYWGGLKVRDMEALKRSLGEIISLWEQGKIAPHVGGVWPLAQASDALKAMQSRRALGKIILEIT